MSSVHRRIRGNFVSAVQDLVPVFAIEPHQISEAVNPKRPTKSLVSQRKRSKRTSAKHINETLSRQR